MTRRMLIDAMHPEETRVVVQQDERLEEFDYETAAKKQLKDNIYLAKVTRVEPSLQAAFVEYGGNRHGFLAFGEIHPDYYRIPISDREALLAHEDEEEPEAATGVVEEIGEDEPTEEAAKRRPRLNRHYKIQEVIKRRQIMLVQVVKEERGNKGAALTTFLSLAGRYCVLMPNTARGGGVSRKITNAQDRKRLKELLSDLSIPQGMGVILRTAGQERSKAEIKRDYDYLLKLWEDIRTRTLESEAPALIHEEGDLIKRSLRDLYDKDIDEVLVAGEEGYRIAKDFMKALIPSHAKKVQPYKSDEGIPMFHHYRVERQITKIFDPVVQLRSGGSIVIHQTEALVAVDVNSGKATRERNIEETAVKTNLEAADEIARQLRLRDLAGLIVIDFIDMEDGRHDAQVERRVKDALKRDRARIQVGRISGFGLLEMSRQRLRPSLQEAMTQACPACHGTGYVQSTELAALTVLRAVEDEAMRRRAVQLYVEMPTDVAVYLLNHKRHLLADVEARYGCRVMVTANADLVNGDFALQRAGEEGAREAVQPFQAQPGEDDRGGRNTARRGRGGRRRGGRDRDDEDGDVAAPAPAPARERGPAPQRVVEAAEADADEDEDEVEDAAQESAAPRGEAAEAGSVDGDDSAAGRRRRRRGRRGGRRRRRGGDEQGQGTADASGRPENADADAVAEKDDVAQTAKEDGAEAASTDAGEEVRSDRPRRGRRGGRNRRPRGGDALTGTQAEDAEAPAETATEAAMESAPVEMEAEVAVADAAPVAEAEPDAPVKPKRASRGRKPKAEPAPEVAAEAAPEEEPAKPKRATRARKPKAAAAEPAPSDTVAEVASQAPVETLAEPVAEPAPAPEPEPEPTPEPAAAPEDPSKPRRKGWWSLGR